MNQNGEIINRIYLAYHQSIILAKKVNSPKFGSTFEIKKVPKRTHVLFHKGNVETQTMGCVILGEQFENLNGKCAVLRSGKAFDEFLHITRGIITFNLQIEDVK